MARFPNPGRCFICCFGRKHINALTQHWTLHATILTFQATYWHNWYVVVTIFYLETRHTTEANSWNYSPWFRGSRPWSRTSYCYFAKWSCRQSSFHVFMYILSIYSFYIHGPGLFSILIRETCLQWAAVRREIHNW